MPNNGEFISAPSPFTDHKESVRVATVADVVLINMPAIIDGVTMGYGDRILVKDQNDPTQNNIYIYLGAGEVAEVTVGGFGGQLSSGALVTIEEGTVNADKIFMLTTDGQITFGETPLTFEETGGGVGGGGGGVALSDNNVWTGTNEFDNEVTLQDTNLRVNGSLIDATANAAGAVWLDAQVLGDATQRFTVKGDGKIEWGDGTGSADVALKRDSAGILRMSTGTNFHVGAANDFYIYGPSASIRMGMGTSHLQIDALDNFGALPWARIKRDADSNYRMLLESDGKIQWGDGTSAPDATLERGFTSGLRFTADQLQLFDRGGALFQGMVIRSTTSGQNALNLQATGDSNPRFLMNIDGDMSWGDGTVAPDTNLYRYSADSLGTDDRLVIKKTGALSDAGASILFRDDTDAFSIGSIHTRIDSRMGTLGDWSHQGNHRWTSTITTQSIIHEGGVIEAIRNTGTDVIHRTKITGDNDYRYNLHVNGTLDWGDGTLPPDTNLYRTAANQLKTDDTFIAVDGITTKVKAGTPVDGDFQTTPSDGTMVVDTTGSLLWVRVGGSWLSTTLA